MNKIQSVIFLVFLYCLNIIDGKSEQDLCKLCEHGLSSDHIFCLFPDPNPANKPGCRLVDISPTNEEFKKKILDWHNNYRNRFAEGSWEGKDKDNSVYRQSSNFPHAANMRLLMWDKQLEKLAMRNAQNCYNKQEHCTALERFNYGQNMGRWTEKTKDALPKDTEGIWEQWVAEMKTFKMADIGEYGKGHKQNDRSTGHFSTATWAKSKMMGCAQVISFDGEKYSNHVVCNYAPTGNVLGTPMYLSGTPGSKCPEGTKPGYDSKYLNLCGGIDPADASYRDTLSNKSSINLTNDFPILFFLACVKLNSLFFVY